jgi:hypothetical protein
MPLASESPPSTSGSNSAETPFTPATEVTDSTAKPSNMRSLRSLSRARARATSDAIGVVQKVMAGGYLISEKPALTGDRLPIYDETGALAYERVFARPDDRLAMGYLSRQAPDLWGRNGVARVDLTGPNGGSIAVEERTAAAALTARFEEVLAQREEERRELEVTRTSPRGLPRGGSFRGSC